MELESKKQEHKPGRDLPLEVQCDLTHSALLGSPKGDTGALGKLKEAMRLLLEAPVWDAIEVLQNEGPSLVPDTLAKWTEEVRALRASLESSPAEEKKKMSNEKVGPEYLGGNYSAKQIKDIESEFYAQGLAASSAEIARLKANLDRALDTWASVCLSKISADKEEGGKG